MKKLSDFEGEKGIVIAANVFDVIMKIITDNKAKAQVEEKNPLKMFSAFMKSNPAEMIEIFAILSEKKLTEYKCNASEALTNILIMANDPILVGLFISQVQTGDATSSVPASESTTESEK